MHLYSVLWRKKMEHFDDLPKRHKNHATGSKAVAAFEKLLSNSSDFVLQASDREDYGADCQIEVVDRECATNVRIHVQLKGTEGAPNADGSISVEIQRFNLNYLLAQPYSFFVCYHVPTDTLRFCFADAVLRQYEHSGKSWTQQQTLTVVFSEILTHERLKSLAALARAGAASSRDARIAQTIARPQDLPGIVKAIRPDLHVPESVVQADAMLRKLYHRDANDVISAAFEKFAAVLRDHEAMIYCYMAEINLGMAGLSCNVARIEDGISLFASQIDAGRFQSGSMHYNIGNGFSALGRDEEATKAYETALEHLIPDQDTTLLAQCYKNLGSSYEKRNYREKAAVSFRAALRHNPQLPEAHCALGHHCLGNGEYEEALAHFDQVVFAEGTLGKQTSVMGWRINVLFNLGDARAAFREINTLLGDAGNEAWIWPWCARQVASFGRSAPENARLSIPFWDRYLTVHPNCPRGVGERLLSKLYLRSEGRAADMTYLAFKTEFETGIRHLQGEAAALLWDRLGHWAQEDENWEEAQRCFRVAYELAGGHYGYCLGTALNFLDRPEESLPLLLPQAETIQPDDLSWYQVAVAYEKLGRIRESIDAYLRCIALNPDCASAWFNMGGVHWNAREPEEASRVWKAAVDRFPDHELAALLRRELPSVLR